jgi:hypothetical protein
LQYAIMTLVIIVAAPKLFQMIGIWKKINNKCQILFVLKLNFCSWLLF